MFVELHARSAFSFLQGACVPEDYVFRATELEMPAAALLDRDGVYGSPRFYLAMKEAGLKSHTGAEILCEDGARYPLLVRDQVGYRNLCRMLTRAKMRTSKDKPTIVTFSDLEEFSPGLICLTGDQEGPLAAAFSKKQGRACLERMIRIFGRSNLYVELQRHFIRNEEMRNQAAIDLARSMKLPLVATNGPAYARSEQREILDVFTCLHNKVNLATAGRLLALNTERYLKSPREMVNLFRDLDEAIINTQEISSQLTFQMDNLGYEFPSYPLPPGQTDIGFLRARTHEGAHLRFQSKYQDAIPQLEHELAVIEKLKLPGYFLIVWDIVNFCRTEKILVQGRGSAANSAVCYSLGITAVNPIEGGLLFERFLTEERGEWPDIDLDLPSGDRRERVIQHVFRLYGERGAAMTANVITYRGRSAAREVGKVMGFDVETLDRLSRLVPVWGWKDPNNTADRQFQEAGLDIVHPKIRKFLDLVIGLQNLPRHLGQHSGGMVICQDRLDSVVPIEPSSMPGRTVVQWDKEDCADMKLIKVDLLGLGMMAVLEDSLVLIHDHYGEDVDLGQLPANDPSTYAALQKADTIGVFQVESRAQQATLPRVKPDRFYDLVVQVAIIRPGPIVGKMVHPYIARRQGKEPVSYLHPLLEPILKRTLGVPLFQEQLLRIAMVAANFTGGEAEELRRALGFKRSQERMKVIEVKLRAGMEKNGIGGHAQDVIVQSITSFALYGFPESHAASFALLAYSSTYLKTHYLAAFTCAILNNQPMGFYHPAVLIKDAQRHGLRVLPMDITRSEWRCTIEEAAGALEVRLGLNYVKGLREQAGAAMLAERALAPFANIDDLARRVPQLRQDEMTKLAETGALNSLQARDRRDALWKGARAVRAVGPLLAEVPEVASEEPLRPMTVEERLHADYSGTGVNIGKHPMAHRREAMDALGVVRAADLPYARPNSTVRVAGCVIVRQRPGTAKGIVFLSLEDETGIANVVVMSEMFDAERTMLVSQPWLLVEGPVQIVDKVIHIRAKRIEPLPYTAIKAASHDFH